MKRTQVTHLIVAVWVGLFLLSFVLMFTLAPTGDGFTRGLNRISAFLAWQSIAFVVAIVLLIVGRGLQQENKLIRWLSRIPVIIQCAMLVLLIGLILVLRFSKPPAEPYVAPGPVTAPAAVAELPAAPEALVAPLEAAVPIEQFSGIYRGGFESSHFYTMDGQGPWWLEADNASWQRIQALYDDEPGRAGGVHLALIVNGRLEQTNGELDFLGIDGFRLHVSSIESMRELTGEEFEQVRQTVTR